jgi:hypothetical protein
MKKLLFVLVFFCIVVSVYGLTSQNIELLVKYIEMNTPPPNFKRVDNNTFEYRSDLGKYTLVVNNTGIIMGMIQFNDGALSDATWRDVQEFVRTARVIDLKAYNIPEMYSISFNIIVNGALYSVNIYNQLISKTVTMSVQLVNK